MNLKGHGVALITPFNINGEIDFNSLKKHLNNLISSKIDYMVVLGTTAEVSTLSSAILFSFVYSCFDYTY